VACDSSGELARRILERHRRSAGVKPLPGSGVILLDLAPAGRDSSAASGSAEVAWEGDRYRESMTSAGVTVTRGIQGGKAFLTDEDGVTRVGSEPMLRELVTRSYFWRRAYLFNDRGGAKLRLGPADDRTASVDLHPFGGNPLRLRFRASDGGLEAVESPRFQLEFTAPRSLRDASRPGAPIAAEIRWIGLPTGTLADEQAGGGRAEFRPSPGVPAEVTSRGPLFRAKVSGLDTQMRLDGGIDGPLRLPAELADQAGLRFERDVFGREIARGARLEIPGLTFPSITVQRVTSPPDTAAEVGGQVFRETVVEHDPGARLLRFHDPDEWVAPENLIRILVDDDGNRPVATLSRSAEDVRVTLGGDTGGPALLLAAESARRAGITSPRLMEGFRWGVLQLPPMGVGLDPQGFSPGWGDDGKMSWEPLRRFHFYLDMPHRWIYLKPAP
jgi:hypothetical protein